MSTYHPKAGDITRNWYVIDATDVVLGRLAVTAADLLRGKGKPQFAPNTDCGDYVIIINADKVHPHNRLGRAVIKKLYVYAGSEHPHAAHKPETYEIKQVAQ